MSTDPEPAFDLERFWMSREWHVINTAPKDGTVIELISEELPDLQPVAAFWNGEFWEGKTFTPMGPRRTMWDPYGSQPTHWRAIQ
jgi:hypothetical protein